MKNTIIKQTNFDMLFKNGNWQIDLDRIERNTCPNKNTCNEYELHLSDTAKQSILDRYI